MSLNSFLVNGESKGVIQRIIEEKVERINKIVTDAYHLCYYHCLRLLEDGDRIPPFDQPYMMKFLRAVTNRGRTSGPREMIIDASIQASSNLLSEKLQHKFSLSRLGLSHLLYEAATDMVTAINNNIIIHFKKRQWDTLKMLNPSKKNKEIKNIQKEINSNNNDDNDGLFHSQLEHHSKKTYELAQKHFYDHFD